MITVANNNYKVVSQSKVKYICPDSGRVGCSVGDILDKNLFYKQHWFDNNNNNKKIFITDIDVKYDWTECSAGGKNANVAIISE